MEEQNMEKLIESIISGLTSGKCANCHNEVNPESLVFKETKFVCEKCVYPQCCFKPCQMIVKAGDDHMKYCEYRPILCKMPSCKWQGSCGLVSQHIVSHRSYDDFGELVFRGDSRFNPRYGYSGAATFECKGMRFFILLSYVPEIITVINIYPILTSKPKLVPVWIKVSFSSSISKTNFEIQLDLDYEGSPQNQITVPSEMVKQKNFTIDLLTQS